MFKNLDHAVYYLQFAFFTKAPLYKLLNIFIKYLNVLTQKIKIILYMAFSFPLKACIKILNIGKCLC